MVAGMNPFEIKMSTFTYVFVIINTHISNNTEQIFVREQNTAREFSTLYNDINFIITSLILIAKVVAGMN